MQPPVSQQFSATPFLLTLLISSNCFDVPRGARTLETCNFRQKCELADLIRLMHECIQTPKCPEPQVLSRLVKGAPAEKINLVVGCDFFLMWDSVGTALQELAHQDMQETRVNHGQGSFQPLPHSAPNEQCVKAARIVPHMSKEQTVALVPEHLKLWVYLL